MKLRFPSPYDQSSGRDKWRCRILGSCESITFDNGVEFLDWRSLEVSLLGVGRRTTIYFAHSYSSCERGTNENHNRMIRRFIPKGTNIALLDEKEIQGIEDWMNDYPRKILAYRTPRQVAQGFLQSNSSDRSIKFCRN
ncbi:MAG: IS30 family transposase [Candidatus Omnitrophica bacterium]|nr:IS30 family transposase [Candidatus Omnitrophota bacterium]